MRAPLRSFDFRHATWLTQDRVMAWATVLLVLEMAFISFVAAW